MAKDSAGATEARHETELAEILAAVQATLARAGLAQGAPRDWSFDDLTPRKATAAEPVVEQVYRGIPGCVLGAAKVVYETLRLRSGENALAQAALARIIEDLALLKRLRESPTFRSGLEHADGISTAAYPAGQQRANNSATILDGLDSLAIDELSPRLGTVASGLASRTTLADVLYRPKGPGAMGHFIFELGDTGMTPREIAEVVEHKKLHRLRKEHGAQQAADYLEDAAANIEKRLKRYREELPPHWRTFSELENVPVAKLAYRALSIHVEANTTVDVPLGGGGALPSAGGHSAPLDPNGAAT
ncbi:MAG: hypothetical protein RL385_1339 [Pseudomonadota bacterium]|jgi:DNA-binding transcriptional MerR regulator